MQWAHYASITGNTLGDLSYSIDCIQSIKASSSLFDKSSSLHAHVQGLASAQTVTLTSSVEQAGRQAACPGEEVTFTCTVIGGAAIQWIVEPFIPQNSPLRFIAAVDTVGAMKEDSSGRFIAVLTSVTQGGLANYSSELTVTATETLNETVVQCSSGTPNLNKTFIVAGIL